MWKYENVEMWKCENDKTNLIPQHAGENLKM